MFALLSVIIILLLGVSLGGMFGVWVGGVAVGLLFLLTYGLERWLDTPLRMGRLPLAVLAPLAWGLTGGFVAMQWMQVRETQVKAPALQPLQRDLEAVASLRSEQGKEVYSLKVEKDKVIYTLEVRYRKDLKPQIPKIESHPTFHGPFIMPTPPKIRFFPAVKGIVTKRWELTLTPVLTGPLDTPRFEIRYRSKGKLHKVVVEPIAIEVSELGKPKELLTTLKPGKAPVLAEKPTDPRQIIWLSGLGLGMLLMLGGVVWLRRRGQREAVALSPHEWVEQSLAQLNQRSLLAEGQFKVHYYAMSEIFRGFLERRFHFPALESTTEEITQWTKQQTRLGNETARDIRQILQWMDNVKFAGHVPTEKEPEDIERRLYSILRRTRPSPEEEQREANQESQSDSETRAPQDDDQE